MSAFSKYININIKKENFKLWRFRIIIISLFFLLVLSVSFYLIISFFSDKNLTNKEFTKITPVLEPVSLKEGEVVYYYPNYLMSNGLTEISCKKLFPLVENGSGYNPKQVASRLVNLSLRDIDLGYFFPYSSVLAGKVADVEVVENNHAYVNFKDIPYIPLYSGYGNVINQNINQSSSNLGLEKEEITSNGFDGQISLPPCPIDLIVDVFNATFAKNYGTKYVYFAINGNVPKFYEMTKLDCPGTDNQCARVDKIEEDAFNFLSERYVFFDKIVVDLPVGWSLKQINENLYAYTVQDPFFINIKISRKLSSEDVSCPMRLNSECKEITINNIRWIYSRTSSFDGYDYILETTQEGLTYSVSIEAKTGDPNSKYIVGLLELLFKSLFINL